MTGKIGMLAAIVAVGATVAVGVAHGYLTNRWGQRADLQTLGKSVDRIPMEFGPWKAAKSTPFPEDTARILRCAGSVDRVYVNQVTGEQMQVSLLIGPPGPASVHTPEICYSSRNYELVGETKRFDVSVAQGTANQGIAQFRRVKMNSRSNPADSQIVCYAWNQGAGWEAPDDPRWHFGGAPFVYKIQVAANRTGAAAGGDKSDDKPVTLFLQDFIPVLARSLEFQS